MRKKAKKMGVPMQLFLKKFIPILAMMVLATTSASAFCPRCAAIESQRAEEEAKHPTKVGYYDDAYPVHQQVAEKQAQNTNQKN
jgi:hypothetical protein